MQPHSDWCACSECDVELRAAAADLERQLDHERALRKFAEERLAQVQGDHDTLRAALLACWHFAQPERHHLKMDGSYCYYYRGAGRVRSESDPWEAAAGLLWPEAGNG